MFRHRGRSWFSMKLPRRPGSWNRAFSDVFTKPKLGPTHREGRKDLVRDADKAGHVAKRRAKAIYDPVVQRVPKNRIHVFLRLEAGRESGVIYQRPRISQADESAYPMSLPYTSPMQKTPAAPQKPCQNAPGTCLAAARATSDQTYQT